ncbi:MAG: DUF1311 domain-containing protein [Asticcacaulis sp.]|nr:DUF1311 domain-containing protein [Asticcacaulis sp.]
MKNFWILAAGLACTIAITPQGSEARDASDPVYSSQFRTCIAKAGAVDFAIAHCNSEEFARQDQTLNTVYAKLVAELEPSRREALRKSERLWVQFREAQCDYEAAGDAGGTLAPVIHENCRMRATFYRTKDLQHLLDLEQ